MALSSRNFLLSINQKNIAGKIFYTIVKEKNKIIKNKISVNDLKKKIYNLGANKIEYIELVNINKLARPYKKRKKYKIFIAYFLGSVRLIDNI